MKLLFVCTHNKMRSRTAEAIFNNYTNCEAKSAGINSGAKVKLHSELITWADIIFVMEQKHKLYLQQNFFLEASKKKIVVLGISDNFSFMQPKLIDLLKINVEVHLKQ